MQVRKAVESMKKKKEPRYFIIEDNWNTGKFIWMVLKFYIKVFLAIFVIFMLLWAFCT